MDVKLLVDLTKYDPNFKKGAIGTSNMRVFLNGYYDQVFVTIQGHRIPVGVDGVECTDARYLQMREWQKEIDEEDRLAMLSQAEQVYLAVGPRGGERGIYLRMKDQSEPQRYAGKAECRTVLQVCEKHGIPYEIKKESEL